MRQICAIYVYNNDQKRSGLWAKEFLKVKSVSMQIDALVAQIKSDRARRTHNKIDEPLAFQVFDSNADLKTNDSFIRSHLLIDCLLRMKDNSDEINKFIDICQQEYQNNKSELANIRDFQQNYNSNRAIRWYTKQSFLFRMLNKALRIQNIDILFLFRFFLCDLQQQLIKNQPTQPMHLYRSQLLTKEQFQLLKKSVGGFFMINTFLSTTLDRDMSLSYLDTMDTSDEFEMQRVLFEIDADPQIEGVQPFANIIWLSFCFGQQEILMMTGSIFRIIQIENPTNQFAIIRLVLCSENNQELQNAFEHVKKEYTTKTKMDLFSFGHVLCDLGNYDDAKRFYLRFLDDLPSNHQDIVTCYQALGDVAADKGEADLSLEWYEKLHDLLARTLKPDDARLADSHSMIAGIYLKKNDFKHALESFNKALIIYRKAYEENNLITAQCLDKIGMIHEKEKKYFQALNYYEKSLTIHQKTLPSEHVDLARAHSKVANIRLLLCHYYLALGHYNISLKIKLNSLPTNHFDVASDYRGLAQTYKARGELTQALAFYEKAAEIYRTQLPSTHPDVIEIERTIRFLSQQTK